MLASGALSSKITFFAVAPDPQLSPKQFEIDRDRLGSHLFVELPQNGDTNRLVSDLDHPVDRPIAINGTACGEDCAQRMLEPKTVARSLPDSDVRAQAKKGAAPVSSSPSGCAVQATIPRLGLTLRKTDDEVVPYLLACQDTRSSAGDRFHISCQPLFKPMVSLGERGKRQVDHFVRKQPVIRETCDVASRPSEMVMSGPRQPKAIPPSA